MRYAAQTGPHRHSGLAPWGRRFCGAVLGQTSRLNIAKISIFERNIRLHCSIG